jgi:hypothetical protein
VKKLPLLIFVFSLAFAFFIIAPGLLNKPFTPLPEMKIADVLDLFTPLILIPLYYLLFYFGSSQNPGLKSTLLFLVFAVLWVEGQAMHLGANSIGHWLVNLMNEDVYEVTHFYDEILSHILWHLGVVALSAQLIYRNWKYPFQESASQLIIEIIAGIVYGFTIFVMGIEGGTVVLLYPYSVLAVIFALIWGWRKFQKVPVLTFFLVGYGLAAILFTGWGLYWGYFPEFSELGWI